MRHVYDDEQSEVQKVRSLMLIVSANLAGALFVKLRAELCRNNIARHSNLNGFGFDHLMVVCMIIMSPGRINLCRGLACAAFGRPAGRRSDDNDDNKIRFYKGDRSFAPHRPTN